MFVDFIAKFPCWAFASDIKRLRRHWGQTSFVPRSRFTDAQASSITTSAACSHVLPNPLTVCRYHSLVVEEASLPRELAVTARTDDGLVMAIAHRDIPVVGVQFHPEAVLTEDGYELLSNFLDIAGVRMSRAAEPIVEHRTLPTIDNWPEIVTPITF